MTQNNNHVQWAWELEISNDRLATFIACIDREFPTQEDILKEFEKMIWGTKPLCCVHCQSVNIERDANCRRWKCEDCFLYTYLTAGTLFHGMKNPRAWIIALKLQEARIFVSSCRFHKFVGVAQSTALQIFKKIFKVIESAYEDEETEISTGVFSRIFCKRSRETPEHEHPRSEQTKIDRFVAREARRARQEIVARLREDAEIEGELDVDGNSVVSAEQLQEMNLTPEDSLTDIQLRVFELIEYESISFDELLNQLNIDITHLSAALTILELAGLVRREPGDHYVRCKPGESFESQHDKRRRELRELSFDAIMFFIEKVYHGVSRKHIQKYVASFWCFFDHENWNHGKLFAACSKHKTLTESEINQDVTPAFMKIPALCLSLPHTF